MKTLRAVQATCVLALGLALPQQVRAQPPSFDCGQATTEDEFAICADPYLSALDAAYAAAFAHVRDAQGLQKALSIARPALQQRHACGGDAACIEATLSSAIAAFAATAVPAAPSPTATPSGSSMPDRLGACARSTIAAIEGRLSGDSTFESGTAVIFANNGYQVSYDREPAIIRSSIGDSVEICLTSTPEGCPPGDDRGRRYLTTNLNTGESWDLPDAEHECGGA